MESNFDLYRELFELSLNEKRGLTIFFRGQQIAGIVTKIAGGKTIEIRSQTYSRAIVSIDSIDAVAVG